MNLPQSILEPHHLREAVDSEAHQVCQEARSGDMEIGT